MDNTERIELLRKVAEVAPKEMGAQFREGYTSWHTHTPLSVVFMGNYTCLGLANDIQDAAACFAMLEAMEEDSYCVLLGKEADASHRCWVGSKEVGCNYFGDTRAEAVARAFVRVFGGD